MDGLSFTVPDLRKFRPFLRPDQEMPDAMQMSPRKIRGIGCV